MLYIAKRIINICVYKKYSWDYFSSKLGVMKIVFILNNIVVQPDWSHCVFENKLKYISRFEILNN